MAPADQARSQGCQAGGPTQIPARLHSHTAYAGGLSSPRRLPPAESRALSWLAFAKACCGEAWDAPAPQCDSAAFAQAASQLAAQEPFQASCSEVALQVASPTRLQ